MGLNHTTAARPKVFWFFGRSAAGKTTLARRLHRDLKAQNVPTFYLDGDELRSGLCADLGFTSEARLENHRRCAEVARLALAQGYNVVASTMAPEHRQRDEAQRILGDGLVWIYIHAPIEICIQRDPKGLYHRAKAGKLEQLLDSPFDAPRPAESNHYIDTVAGSIEACAQSVWEAARGHLMVQSSPSL